MVKHEKTWKIILEPISHTDKSIITTISKAIRYLHNKIKPTPHPMTGFIILNICDAIQVKRPET